MNLLHALNLKLELQDHSFDPSYPLRREAHLFDKTCVARDLLKELVERFLSLELELQSVRAFVLKPFR